MDVIEGIETFLHLLRVFLVLWIRRENLLRYRCVCEMSSSAGAYWRSNSPRSLVLADTQAELVLMDVPSP